MSFRALRLNNLKFIVYSTGIFILVSPGHTSSSAGVIYSWGVNYYGAEATASLDLDKDAVWNTGLDYSYGNSTDSTTPSITNQITLSLTRSVEETWEYESSATYSADTTNGIYFAGPSLEVSYTANKSSAKDDENLLSDDADDELWSCSLTGNIYGYQANVGQYSATGLNKKGLDYTYMEGTGVLYDTQFNPRLDLEVPLWAGLLTPSVSYSHYFYSSDPAVIAGIINKRFSSSPAAAQINNLVGRLYYNSWQGVLMAELPWNIMVDGNYGQQELVSPDTWISSYGADFAVKFLDKLRAKLSFSETDQTGTFQDVYSAGLTYTF